MSGGTTYVFYYRRALHSLAQCRLGVPGPGRTLGMRHPNQRRHDVFLNFPNDRSFRVRQHNRFALKHSGYFHAPRTGVYHFRLRSDDGSALYIRRRRVVNNDGLHGPRNRQGRTHLTRGWHEFQVYFFENAGGAYLRLWWWGPGVRHQYLRSYRRV